MCGASFVNNTTDYILIILVILDTSLVFRVTRTIGPPDDEHTIARNM